MKLTISLVAGALTDPILSGKTGIDGVEVDARTAKMVDGNSRAMIELKFDVAEMSLATFVKARDDGVKLIGLPVFTGRRFLESGIGVRPQLGIKDPRQLAGKRVGVPQFWMTSSVWHRAVLSEVYGVPQNTVTWITVQPERFTLAWPAGLKVEHHEGGSLDAMLQKGEIDAVLFPRAIENHFAPTTATSPFGDIVAAQRAFLDKTKMFPIMHFVVMREALHRETPGLAPRIIAAFDAAKRDMLRDPKSIPARDLPFHDADYAYGRSALGDDPWPYGVAANRGALEWFLARAHAQGLTRTRLAPKDLFVEGQN
jgi:4,5-dihydroxyphthalate decarboxylase